MLTLPSLWKRGLPSLFITPLPAAMRMIAMAAAAAAAEGNLTHHVQQVVKRGLLSLFITHLPGGRWQQRQQQQQQQQRQEPVHSLRAASLGSASLVSSGSPLNAELC
jgi:hypothetical protein